MVAYPSSGEVLEPSRPTSPPKRQICAPPSHPDRCKQYAASSSSSTPDTNPFAPKSLEPDLLQSLPFVQHELDAPPVIPSRPLQKTSHNPFLMRDNVNGMVGVNRSPEKLQDGKIPPLPPRKPAPLIAPKRYTSSAQPPLFHRDINPSHVMTPLMKQSLAASKHGQSMKRLEEQLDRERIMQVLKTTSSGSSASSRARSLSPAKQPHKGFGNHSSGSEDTYPAPALPRRLSSSSSTSSLPSIDQVASASMKVRSSFVSTPFRPPLPDRESVPPTTADGPSHLAAPPTHPDRRNDTAEYTTSTTPRVTRSKSMHHTSTPPLPPPRRRRPDSVHLTPTSNTNIAEIPSSSQARTSSTSVQGLSRHASYSRDRRREWDRNTTDASPISHIQKTITNLQLKAQPRIDAARYKAEAGLSRRGFVSHSPGGRWMGEGEQGLMTDTDTRWEDADDGTHVDQDAGPYSEPPTEEDRDRVEHTKAHHDSWKQADNLKWPAGEGWRPLES